MSATEYIRMDDTCLAHDDLQDWWENDLLQEATYSPRDEDHISDDDNTETTPSSDLTDGEAQEMFTTFRNHLLHVQEL